MAASITLQDIVGIATLNPAKYNANNAEINEALQRGLSRHGMNESNNSLLGDIDANNQQIRNLRFPVLPSEAVTREFGDVEYGKVAADAAKAARDAAIIAQGLAELAQAAAEAAQGDAEAAQDFAEIAQLAAENARSAAEAARDAAEGFRDQAEGHKNVAQAAQTAAETAQLAAEAAQGDAEAAQDFAEIAQLASENARDASEGARDLALAHRNAAEEHKDGAEDAQIAAEAAQGDAEVAQGFAELAQLASENARDASEDARDLALAYRNTAEEHKDDAEDAQLAAEAAQLAAEGARDAAQAAQTAAQNARDKAEEWAIKPEDTPVETGPDRFSALHHAAKANASATASANSAVESSGYADDSLGHAQDSDTARAASVIAQGFAEEAQQGAETAETGAIAAKDKAEQWADEDEDVPVETDPNQFSAKHWAIKSQSSVLGVRVTANDTTPAPLDTKITVSGGVEKTVTSPGGDERLLLGLGSNVPLLDVVNTFTTNQNIQGHLNLGGDLNIHPAAGNTHMEYGGLGFESVVVQDFHTHATTKDYDSRILAKGGTTAVGRGTLEFIGDGGFEFVLPQSNQALGIRRSSTTNIQLGTITNHNVDLIRGGETKLTLTAGNVGIHTGLSTGPGGVAFVGPTMGVIISHDMLGTAGSDQQWMYVGNTLSLNYIKFAGSGGDRGSISTNGTSVSYNTTSDRRLKENIGAPEEAMDDSWDIVKSISVREFNFKANKGVREMGWIADEVQEKLPHIVIGQKNGRKVIQHEMFYVDFDGNPLPVEVDDPQLMDYSKMVPYLWGALEKAIEKIETLEAKVAALETK